VHKVKHMNNIQIIKPDDWHVHFRDNEMLASVVPHTAAQFERCLVMPNLKIPVTNTELALQYYQRIQKSHDNKNFKPYLTIYLTNNTDAQEVLKAKNSGIIKGFKLYPAGATTLSENGVTNIKHCYATLEQMQKHAMPLLVHGEVTCSEVDIFDREAKFIDDVLIPMRKDFPQLKISFEHITTKQAAQYVLEQDSEYLGASITPQHLLYNRNHMLVGGIRPHFYCLPILKRSIHQQALIDVVISPNNTRFYAGTDSAPHTQDTKENACGCAGCYSAAHAVELYASAFDKHNAIDKLERFMSINGANFYNMPTNTAKIKLIKEEWVLDSQFKFGSNVLIPLAAGEKINWKLESTGTIHV
jgi:dihydroorotase